MAVVVTHHALRALVSALELVPTRRCCVGGVLLVRLSPGALIGRKLQHTRNWDLSEERSLFLCFAITLGGGFEIPLF